jgi:hypothetical protein
LEKLGSIKVRARTVFLVIGILTTLTVSVVIPLYSSSFIKIPSTGQSQITSSESSVSQISSTSTYDPITQSTSSTALSQRSTFYNTIEQPKIALPLYSESLNDWFQVYRSSPATGLVVLNADYGPGSAYDSTYGMITSLEQASGAHVLGYVYTNYADGSIPVSEVEQWINDWYSWYHVDGIFFDEVQSTCTNQSIQYYSTLYNYTKSEPGADIVVLNPGNAIGQCYAAISDILVTFEGNYADYLSNYNAPWMYNYPPSHFWDIVYNATNLVEMQSTIQLATQRGAGWIYVSDGLARGVNALGRLPIYFCQEVNFLDPSNSCVVNANATAG